MDLGTKPPPPLSWGAGRLGNFFFSWRKEERVGFSFFRSTGRTERALPSMGLKILSEKKSSE